MGEVRCHSRTRTRDIGPDTGFTMMETGTGNHRGAEFEDYRSSHVGRPRILLIIFVSYLPSCPYFSVFLRRNSWQPLGATSSETTLQVARYTSVFAHHSLVAD